MERVYIEPIWTRRQNYDENRQSMKNSNLKI